jgi:two-component system nitrogen regulation response regulator GlnG
VISADIIRGELEQRPVSSDGNARGDESLGDAVGRHLAQYFDAHREGLPPPGLYDRVLHEIEKPLISLVLSATLGNQLQAAKVLGLNRNTLRKKIRELQIEVLRGSR